MSEAWNRDSFRPGGGDYGLLDEMQAQEAESQKGKGESEKEGGQGVASFNANPKPGDELYDTLHQARAEATQHSQTAQQPQHQAAAVSDDSALTFAALIAASSQQQGQQQGQGPQQQQQEPTPYQAARQEAVQPDAEGPQPATFHALKAEQAAATPAPNAQQQEAAEEGPTRPGDQQAQNGLMSDFVTEDTQKTVEAERTQQQQQQRTRTMGLAL